MRFLFLVTLLLLSSCTEATRHRLSMVGKEPPLHTMQAPTEHEPIVWAKDRKLPERNHPSSLWQPDSYSFFRDHRAYRVGDILRVKIRINDKAELENATKRTRTTKEDLAVPQLFGMQNNLFGILPGKADTSDLVGIAGKHASDGDGEIDREEQIETELAVMVTQVLPNGNLVIRGRQEIRVNFEIREISLEGIVRSKDITTENSVDVTQVAEARINYGGRGTISDVQQPRIGAQIVDILSPF